MRWLAAFLIVVAATGSLIGIVAALAWLGQWITDRYGTDALIWSLVGVLLSISVLGLTVLVKGDLDRAARRR